MVLANGDVSTFCSPHSQDLEKIFSFAPHLCLVKAMVVIEELNAVCSVAPVDPLAFCNWVEGPFRFQNESTVKGRYLDIAVALEEIPDVHMGCGFHRITNVPFSISKLMSALVPPKVLTSPKVLAFL